MTHVTLLPSRYSLGAPRPQLDLKLFHRNRGKILNFLRLGPVGNYV